MFFSKIQFKINGPGKDQIYIFYIINRTLKPTELINILCNK